MRTLLTLVVLTILSAMTATISAQGDTLTEFTFGYNYPVTAAIGDTLYIPITKISGSGIMSGFDFLLRYDEAVLTLQNVFPGHIFDDTSSTDWEHFEYSTYAYDTLNGFVRGFGIADINDGEHHPLSYQIPDSSPMFILQFSVTADENDACESYPIQFYWEDCTSNAIAADSFGYLLGISDAVLDWTESGYVDISDSSANLPGITGAPDVCITDESITRRCTFYNPTIYVECNNDTIASSGDINCNEVPYEMADAVMYFNYFLYGLSAFGEHIECSIAQSDVNADGLVLRLEDAAYLQRIASGDALPYDSGGVEHNHIPVTFLQNTDAKFVSITYSDELSAISLTFNGEITPTFLITASDFITTYSVQGGDTRVLVCPDVSAQAPGFFADSLLLTYTGEGTLYEAGAADNEDNVFDAQITHIGGVSGTPYAFQIGYFPNAAYGQELSIPVTKMGGSENFSGFDFLFGYEQSLFNVTSVTPGTIFDQPGSYEWEYFNYRYDQTDCADTICPSYMLRVVGLADMNDGPHQPLSITVPDTTVMFTIDGSVTSDTVYGDLHADMRFLWIDCGDNAVAMGSTGEVLALSRYVYSYDGGDITSPYYPLPSRYGAPESCITGSLNPPVRFADFRNGGYDIEGAPLTPKLLVDIGNQESNIGDTAIFIDVYMANYADSVAGFSLFVSMDQPDLAEFGISPDDTLAFTTEGTAIEDWAFVVQSAPSDNYNHIKIVGLANIDVPFNESIPPSTEPKLLVRLIAHGKPEIPEPLTDSVVGLYIIQAPSETGFSDPLGNLIGLDGLGYNPEEVFFSGGHILFRHQDFVDGDINNDGFVNIGDAVSVINYVFAGGQAPQPLCSGDVNCDGFCDIGDPIYLINYIFKQGDVPCSGCR